MGESPGMHGILPGASPASAGPRNISQAYGRRAEGAFSGFFVQPCTRPSRGPPRRLAGDNLVIPGETTVCLRRGCGLTPARVLDGAVGRSLHQSRSAKMPLCSGPGRLPFTAWRCRWRWLPCRPAAARCGSEPGCLVSARGSARPSGRPAPASAPGTGKRPRTSRRQAPAPSAL